MGKFVDLTGQRFGKLTVIGRAPNIGKLTAWTCRCDCGSITVKKGIFLTQGDTKSCGCEWNRKPKDETGNVYGRLTVIGFSHSDTHGNHCWTCRCECGNEISVLGASLRRGHTQSCGCLNRDAMAEVGRSTATHHKTKTRLHHVWISMLNRCNNCLNDAYQHYGGRGIKVCDEWLGADGFQHFWDWAYQNGYDENAPKGQCTIDRINVNGDYEPSNCRWTDTKTQANNKRSNVYITIDGVNHTISEWSKISGINKGTIRQRYHKGWSAKDAVFLPPLKLRRKRYESIK